MSPKKTTSKESSLAKPAKAPSNASLITNAFKSVDLAFQAVGYVLNRKPEPAVLAAVYTLVNNQWLKPMEELRKSIRDALVEAVRANNGNEVVLNFGRDRLKVRMVEPRSKAPSVEKLRELCEERGIDYTTLCTPTVEYVPSQAALVEAVDAGKLTAEDIASCCKSLGARLEVEKL